LNFFAAALKRRRRIELPVLSVVAQQVLAITNAKRVGAPQFAFPGDAQVSRRALLRGRALVVRFEAAFLCARLFGAPPRGPGRPAPAVLERLN
jgi:hypothetical protein